MIRFSSTTNNCDTDYDDPTQEQPLLAPTVSVIDIISSDDNEQYTS